jgi:hypothetical protein
LVELVDQQWIAIARQPEASENQTAMLIAAK